MKVEATCGTCGRRFELSQIGPESDAPSRCPFCGTHFATSYSTVLPNAVVHAERTAGEFVAALGRLQGMETGFDMDLDGLLKKIRDQISDHEAPRSKAG